MAAVAKGAGEVLRMGALPRMNPDASIVCVKPVSATRTPTVAIIPGTRSASINARIAGDAVPRFPAHRMGVMPRMDRGVEGAHARNVSARRIRSAATTHGIIPASIYATTHAADVAELARMVHRMDVPQATLQGVTDAVAKRAYVNWIPSAATIPGTRPA